MSSIFQAECLEAIADYDDESVDVAFLDPPYNTKLSRDKTVTYDRNEDFKRKNWSNFQADWDDIADYRSWAGDWLRALRPKMAPASSLWLCGSFHNIPEAALALRDTDWWTISWVSWCIPNAFPNLQASQMASSMQTLIWARPNAEGKKHRYNYEAAKLYNEGKNLRTYWNRWNSWEINNDSQAGRLWKHKSKKPPALVRRAVHITAPLDREGIVVDFFGGSGTTGVAVDELNARYGTQLSYILSDREPEYVAMMQQRLSEA